MLPPFRILVTGSRDWKKEEVINNALDEFLGAPNTVLVHGACPTGADAMANVFGEDVGWEIEPHPANWDLFGKQAGYIRNSEMVALGADICLAFNLADSRGTVHCLTLAKAAGIQTIVYNEE